MRNHLTSVALDESGHDSAPKIKVLIADDHPMIVTGVRRSFEHIDEIEVVGEAHSGDELVRLIELRRPDLVLMDLRMPGLSGAECIEHIRNNWPEVKVVVLSASDDRGSIDSALAAGASAYILKSAAAVDIMSVIRQAASGNVFHAPAVRRPLFGAVREPEMPLLTDRERSILSAVATGMTTAAISRELWVTEHTIKFHLTNIYRKLGVANRASAVRYALDNDLVAA
jgi:DNA-binding NarL/FixJ family response regulator